LKLYQRTSDTRASIAQVPGSVLVILGTKEELDELENSIARIANLRNKKAAAARRLRRDKVRSKALTYIGRGMNPAAAYEKASQEVDSV
jgi:glucosamine 6-phosphate synthetase-like amidotransferase/phosphosugar isomerase protein